MAREVMARGLIMIHMAGAPMRWVAAGGHVLPDQQAQQGEIPGAAGLFAKITALTAVTQTTCAHQRVVRTARPPLGGRRPSR
jgi:hypothetical protein